jgi:hypothetical protein
MAELRWQKYDGYFHDAIVKQRTDFFVRNVSSVNDRRSTSEYLLDLDFVDRARAVGKVIQRHT